MYVSLCSFVLQFFNQERSETRGCVESDAVFKTCLDRSDSDSDLVCCYSDKCNHWSTGRNRQARISGKLGGSGRGERGGGGEGGRGGVKCVRYCNHPHSGHSYYVFLPFLLFLPPSLLPPFFLPSPSLRKEQNRNGGRRLWRCGRQHSSYNSHHIRCCVHILHDHGCLSLTLLLLLLLLS